MRIGDVLKILHKKVAFFLYPAAVLLFSFIGVALLYNTTKLNSAKPT